MLPNFKEWVPQNVRLGIYFLFLLIFQFSNGMYFAAMTQMSSELSISMNDTLMLSNAILMGVTLYFPLAFRLKARFTNYTLLLVAACGTLLCNLLVPHVNSTLVLFLICLIAGFLRLMGTFECLSNMLPKITPTYNYAIFLSFVFLIVIGLVQVLDIGATYIIYFFHWKYIHLFAIGMLCVLIACVLLFMRPVRQMPMKPLYGLDGFGMLLWAVCILSLIFVVQYGQQLDWCHSPYIRAALGASCLALAANLWRMHYTRHPFLEQEAFRSKNLWPLLLAFLIMDILLSSQNVLQNTLTSEIMHLDMLHNAQLKWFPFLGAALAAVLCCYLLAFRHWSRKTVFCIGMCAVVLYLLLMFKGVSADMNMEKLYLPLLLSGFGNVAIFISLTVYAQATTDFRYYFQVLCILGFIRTGLAGPLGSALYSRAMTWQMRLQLAQPIDGVDITGALTASMHTLWGYSVIAGALVLLCILAHGRIIAIIHSDSYFCRNEVNH